MAIKAVRKPRARKVISRAKVSPIATEVRFGHLSRGRFVADGECIRCEPNCDTQAMGGMTSQPTRVRAKTRAVKKVTRRK